MFAGRGWGARAPICKYEPTRKASTRITTSAALAAV
jgi:hypothetical protein